MERLIETALMPGRFVSYNASFSFVRELAAVERRLAPDLSTNPPQPVALYEALLAGCYEKAEEIDDSSGSFGDFVGQVHCMWIKARQAAGADPNEIATRLLAWMEGRCASRCGSADMDLPTPHGVPKVDRLDTRIDMMEEEARLLKGIFESVTKLGVAHGAAS